MKYLKVITHDTFFHADEVVAIALLRRAGYQIDLIRTRSQDILNEALLDSSVAVVDVGGAYDPATLNFDHHQDMSLQSAAGLIYNHVKNVVCPLEAQPYFERFIASIDAVDTNRDNIFAKLDLLPKGFRNTSALIGGFNRENATAEQQMENFWRAVDFSSMIIENEVNSALKKARSEAAYEQRTILWNNVAVFDEHSSVWKSKKEHLYAVMPHANGWQINSRDTSLGQIPEQVFDCEGFVFRHKSGFMTVIREKAVALEFAATLPHYEYIPPVEPDTTGEVD
ncbi:MAG TPA: MYG1 family protein [Dyadobacter sp.]|jgi:uncharacterized UPF0160 family protein|nr:MYG1 family protein [Dyadobacter sp.]